MEAKLNVWWLSTTTGKPKALPDIWFPTHFHIGKLTVLRSNSCANKHWTQLKVNDSGLKNLIKHEIRGFPLMADPEGNLTQIPSKCQGAQSVMNDPLFLDSHIMSDANKAIFAKFQIRVDRVTLTCFGGDIFHACVTIFGKIMKVAERHPSLLLHLSLLPLFFHKIWDLQLKVAFCRHDRVEEPHTRSVWMEIRKQHIADASKVHYVTAFQAAFNIISFLVSFQHWIKW